jgi:hypothetical protein
MKRYPQSDRDQMVYRTYDDRLVTRSTIDLALKALDQGERRRERLQRVRMWALTLLIVVALLAASGLVWLRLTIPF